MAISYINSAQIVGSSGSTFSTTYTVTGEDPVLFFLLSVSASSVNITSANYNGVPLTKVGDFTNGVNYHIYVYYILNPSQGIGTISGTLSGSQQILYGISLYNGVKGIDNTLVDSTGQTTKTYSNSITSTVDNCWGILFVAGTATIGDTTTGSPIKRYRTTFDYDFICADTNGVISPAGSTTLSAGGLASNQVLKGILVTMSPAIHPTMTGIQSITF